MRKEPDSTLSQQLVFLHYAEASAMFNLRKHAGKGLTREFIVIHANNDCINIVKRLTGSGLTKDSKFQSFPKN